VERLAEVPSLAHRNVVVVVRVEDCR
jgi:hypothetical protein